MKLHSLVYPSNLTIRLQKITVFSVTFALILSLILFIPSNSFARVTGVCSNCHTMHNSQGGSSMQTGYNPGSGPQATMLRANGCIGCHGAADGATWQGVGGAPVVYNAVAPSFNTQKGLAAGNFYYVQASGDAYGHNVKNTFTGVGDDLNHVGTPGAGGDGCAACHATESTEMFVVMGGDIQSGCEFCHDVKHHTDDSATVVGASGGYYRFLSFTAGHPAGFQQGLGFDGCEGIEDDDWEKTVSSTDHNEYSGAPASGYSHSISKFCYCCHEEFHGTAYTQSGSDWIRHPSDHVLPASGEYSSYTTYSPEAPIARDPTVLSGMAGPSGTVTPGSDQVSCLSCHRAHASPNTDMLRWDYSGMIAGSGGTGGCFTCHTQKDDS